jgi:hypothetical protein
MSEQQQRGYLFGHRIYAKTRQLIDVIHDVLDEYRDNLPMTQRQIYYRLVGRGFFGKSENSENRLEYALGIARRAIGEEWHIPFENITDADVDGLWLPRTDVILGRADFWRGVERDARRWSREASEDQPSGSSSGPRPAAWSRSCSGQPRTCRARCGAAGARPD